MNFVDSRRATVSPDALAVLEASSASLALASHGSCCPTHVRLQPRSPATLVRARDQVSHPIKDQLRHRHQRTAGNER